MDELANINSIFTRELLQKFNLIVDKEDIKKHIRELADNDNCFDNLVFELGCESLAEYCCKEMRKI